MKRIKVSYDCGYDGKPCEVVPKFNESGYLIPESNEMLRTKYQKVYANHEIESSWDRCMKCPRNNTISGTCRGRIKMEVENETE